MSSVRIGTFTTVGRMRRESEDRVWRSPADDMTAVVDGSGGRGLAADLLVRVLSDKFLAGLPDGDTSRAGPLVQETLREANALVHEVMRTRPELKGIGAVAAVAWFGGDPARGAFCQIGDCRVYRLRSGRLEQLSADDRWLAEQVRNGAMTPTEARSHPLKNVVTRAISGSDVNVDVHSIALRPGDRVILCTDGVWEHTSDAVLAECCSERSFEVAWSRLLRPESGDVAVPDDASLAIVEIEE